MRLKDPFSLKAADMTKRSNKPRKPRDEDSSDEVSGLTCQHVSKAVDLNSVKKSILSSVWLVCSDCLRERTMVNGEPEASQDVLVCLKCGFQGCDLSGTQHAVKHHQAFHSESHCITISLSTWKAWCFECNEELSTHCNKKALAQTLDFLQKHSLKATSASPKIMKLQEEPSDYADPPRGKSSVINSTLAPVKGINNLGNTCFFNAVMNLIGELNTRLLLTGLLDCFLEVTNYFFCFCFQSSLTVGLPNPEPLTAAMFVFLQSMKESGKGPLNPKALFNQLCQKAPRFKGYQQQDSQELLHYLLDSIRMEETKVSAHRTCTHMLAYGKEGVKLNFVDRIFVGELTNTIMCEECSHISTVKEAFIDISLPIIEERVLREHSGGECCGVEQPEEEEVMGSTQSVSSCKGKVSAAGSQSDGSERESGTQDSSNDADSEASESEWAPRASPSTHGHSYTHLIPSPTARSASSSTRQGGAVEQLLTAVSQVSLGLGSSDGPEEQLETHNRDNLHHQGAFQALSHSYTPSSKECSIQSCLHQFTSVELLMGNNKLLCESCTERRHKLLRRSGSADKKLEKIYTSARKQMLISLLPPVITLHLKRFHQAGMNLRKVNRHVDFPLVLDLAPFCSASCKNLATGERVLYSLYGIVEHSGSMRGGHYTAYVKVRTPQRKSELHNKNLPGARDSSSSSQGQWVYVSDTTVQTVPESRVLNSQAYLLFYEELL
uniref:ubiquitinyl hydrolase 1 n=1 Tax=Gouania willdenowi TaxID=441366 RepID=A0A8C5DZU1_GOUWI